MAAIAESAGSATPIVLGGSSPRVDSSARSPELSQELSQAKWKAVLVYKKNADGSYIYKKNSDGTYPTQIVNGREERIRLEMPYTLEVDTGTLWFYEQKSVTYVKLGLAFCIGNPLMTAARIVGNVIKIFVDIPRIAYNTLKAFGERVQALQFTEALTTLIKGFFWELPTEVGNNVLEIARDIIFGLGMQFTTFMGIVTFSPLFWRKATAYLENKLQHDIPYKHDCKAACPQGGVAFEDGRGCEPIQRMYNVVVDPTKSNYLAVCFQPHGRLTDRHDVELIRDAPLYWFEEIFPQNH